MHSRHFVTISRWAFALGALAAILLVYRRWFHVNPTTVALTLVLFILVVASRWTLRAAILLSFLATACYNFYFLPPVGTFTIADPQNWLALFAFLATSVLGSRLSQRARHEAEEARRREREVQVLFSLSRELLQTENVIELVNSLPRTVYDITRASSVVLYLLDGDRLYQAGTRLGQMAEIPHLRTLALSLSGTEDGADEETRIVLRAGVRPRGLLLVRGVTLSAESFQAIGGLVSIALDRAQALEDVSKSEASKESERLRNLILDSITHELRTPLTSIKGAATTLLAGTNVSNEDRHELLTIVDEESDRLNRLIGQAVEMAQIEAQQVQFHLQPVTLAGMVSQAEASCGAVLATHAVSTRLPELPDVVADPEMIAKVLCNLLENAAKYSQPQSPIVVSAEVKDGFVQTSIADRGTGIDPVRAGLYLRPPLSRALAGRGHARHRHGARHQPRHHRCARRRAYPDEPARSGLGLHLQPAGRGVEHDGPGFKRMRPHQRAAPLDLVTRTISSTALKLFVMLSLSPKQPQTALYLLR